MNHAIKDRLLDCSTQDTFRFKIVCESCGETWHSKAVPFSKAGKIADSTNKQIIFNILYEKEKQYVRESVMKEAGNFFNRCPVCQRIVCDYCFLICEDLDMCTHCAKKLNEQGEVVLAPEKEASAYDT